MPRRRGQTQLAFSAFCEQAWCFLSSFLTTAERSHPNCALTAHRPSSSWLSPLLHASFRFPTPQSWLQATFLHSFWNFPGLSAISQWFSTWRYTTSAAKWKQVGSSRSHKLGGGLGTQLLFSKAGLGMPNVYNAWRPGLFMMLIAEFLEGPSPRSFIPTEYTQACGSLSRVAVGRNMALGPLRSEFESSLCCLSIVWS